MKWPYNMHSQTPGLDRVCAIILSYHPSPMIKDVLKMIAAQVSTVFVVENGSPANVQTKLRALLDELNLGTPAKTFELITNESNRGVDAAFNQGISRALREELDFAILLDQDSVVEPEAVGRLIRAFSTGRRIRKVGMVCARNVDFLRDVESPPSWYDRTKSLYHRARGAYRDSSSEETFFAMFSGSLINLAAIREVGSLREDYFIDADDKEFCFRLRKSGWTVLSVPTARVRHRVGSVEGGLVNGLIKAGFTSHEPWRSYYTTRNTFVTVKEYFSTFPAETMLMLSTWFLFFLEAMVAGPRRLSALSYSARGLRDFLGGNMGESVTPPLDAGNAGEGGGRRP